MSLKEELFNFLYNDALENAKAGDGLGITNTGERLVICTYNPYSREAFEAALFVLSEPYQGKSPTIDDFGGI